MNRSLIEQINRKKLIFSVTTGRSGTTYLSVVFSYMKDVAAYHEPEPEYVEVLRKAQGDRHMAKAFLLNKKLPQIARIQDPVYVETSHLICKGFLESFLDLGIVPSLVIHRRPPREVSLSLLKMGTIPGRNEKALRFYLSPDDPGVLRLENWNHFTDYQLCFWYCLEMERRAKHYSGMFREAGSTIAETTLAELKTLGGLEKLATIFDLKLKSPAFLTRIRFKRNSRFKINESLVTKKKVDIPELLEEQEGEVLNAIT